MEKELKQEMTPEEFKEQVSMYKNLYNPQKCKWCGHKVLVFLGYQSDKRKSELGGGIEPIGTMYVCRKCGRISFFVFEKGLEGHLDYYMRKEQFNRGVRESNKKILSKKK